MGNMLKVSSSPHVRSKDTTDRIMLYVVLALLPASMFGVYNFGYRALVLIVVTIVSCMASELVFEKITKRPNTLNDMSAVVTGLLLALNLPVSLPYFQAALGGIFAIIVVKMLFGGLGQNFMNPALGARCFLLISFTGSMTAFTYDGVSCATPLALLKNAEPLDVSLMDMFVGKTAGTIGETSVIAILLGAAFLVYMKVIDLKIPLAYIATFLIFILLFGGHGADMDFVIAQLCGGGLMLGAFFMATDYVTSPITPLGQIVFGIVLGLLTGIFRMFGANAEGVSYAIILSNLFVPLIERFTVPAAFGKGGKKA